MTSYGTCCSAWVFISPRRNEPGDCALHSCSFLSSRPVRLLACTNRCMFDTLWCRYYFSAIAFSSSNLSSLTLYPTKDMHHAHTTMDVLLESCVLPFRKVAVLWPQWGHTSGMFCFLFHWPSQEECWDLCRTWQSFVGESSVSWLLVYDQLVGKNCSLVVDPNCVYSSAETLK